METKKLIDHVSDWHCLQNNSLVDYKIIIVKGEKWKEIVSVQKGEKIILCQNCY